MLGLGLGGVVVIASQANRQGAPPKAGAQAPAASMEPRVTRAMGSDPPRERPRPMRPAGTLDAGVPRPVATPDAAVTPSPDAAAPKRPASEPDAAVAATGPPKQTGSAPVLVVQFKTRSTRPPKKFYRAIRKMVRTHGYKGVRYQLTGYGAERRRPKHNRALARRRCRKVARLIRKRGVSRRWIHCGPPVFRTLKRKPTDADKTPSWRRVEIRVEKP
jgi:outer membrane protein OmpA-like peptidoglycan-associated protein